MYSTDLSKIESFNTKEDVDKFDASYYNKMFDFIQDNKGSDIVLSKISKDVPKIVYHIKFYIQAQSRLNEYPSVVFSSDYQKIKIS